MRLAIGGLFIFAAVSKFQDMTATAAMFGNWGFPAPEFFAWLTAITELLGGVLIVLGLWTSMAALVLAVVMVVALLVVHLPAMSEVGFDGAMRYNLAMLGAAFGLSAVGGGTWGLGKDCACGTKKK